VFGSLVSPAVARDCTCTADLPRDTGVAVLQDAVVITGKVFNKQGFRDGDKIQTSPVASVLASADGIKTMSGSVYRLGRMNFSTRAL
jgi:hypothetical protein